MLNQVRERIDPWITRLGLSASNLGISANIWTYIGLVLALLSALAYSGIFFGGALLGGVLLLLSGFTDVVDGAVARVRGTVSKKGGFLDSILDRMGEVFIFAGILVGGYVDPIIVMLAISFSILVSYVRAKAELHDIKIRGIGVGERAERILVIAILSIVGVVWLGVVLVLILAIVTFVQRITYITGKLT
uniref:CDP-alcohol phosphatidyltransferase (PgsA, PGS1) n=1 Tax=uncultured marine thaumarchaeote KM3_73_F02 TaxID=1456268 RepID=A0A075HR08_9ARCH|nr:CDP-alcohol phosphatidyltransferase (pgsA, PGS1) [uncultured marine thaumarchaeote KM3_73_F02]